MSTIETVIDDLRAGKMIILTDDEDRENEGDLIIAAEKLTTETANFMARYGRGLTCIPMAASEFERLGIPLMVKDNRSPNQTAFGVSIGAATGVTTGISCADRARTAQVAADPNSSPDDIIMPGHLLPLRAQDGGVLTRAGHTEGSVDLMRLAGLQPVAVLCEILKEDGSMARRPDLDIFAKTHGLSMTSIAELKRYRLKQETLVDCIATSILPIEQYGEFTIKVFRHRLNGSEHVMLSRPSRDSSLAPLVRLHSQCLTGDLFGSQRCDCGEQLHLSLAKIAEQGGILLYLQQEGRGIGLANKIKAYALQDKGMDTVEANHELGFAADERDYAIAAQILRAMDMTAVRLLTNNPRKVEGLNSYGVKVVERLAVLTAPNHSNQHYLQTKQHKLGHWLDTLNKTAEVSEC